VRFEVFALALSTFQNPRIDEVQRVAEAHHRLNVIPPQMREFRDTIAQNDEREDGGSTPATNQV